MRKESFKDDLKLVEACINKDLIAWAIFIRKYSNLIAVSIDNRLKKYGFTLTRQDIEDIQQNILTSLWKDKKLESVKNRKDISYWLAIVSGNMAIEYLRNKQNIEAIKSVSLHEKIDEKELAQIIPSGKSDPRDELSKNELSEKINSSIERLPTKEKLIAKLNILHDKKYHEIANILNLPEGTISSYMKRAKEKLKKALIDYR